MGNQRRRVVLVGTGGLATAVALALPTLAGPQLAVDIVGRRGEVAERLCHLAAARAAALGSGDHFAPVVDSLDGDRPRPWTEPPDLVVVLASSQSPWEARERPSAWTDLVAAGGFGVTLPFQSDLARRLAPVAADEGAALVNGCLPDLVNPVLAALGTPALTGLGNGATIHAFVSAAARRADLRVLAHHYHLHAPGPGFRDASVVTDDGDVLDATTLLAPMRTLPRAHLNQVTGLVSAQVIRALLDESATLRTTLPGVHDRQGGAPVRIADGRVTVDLGAAWSESDVTEANDVWSLADGARVRDGSVTLSDRAVQALSTHLPGQPGEFPVTDLPAFARSMSALRDTLRTQPPGEAP